jgi:uncharacterized membrane protein YfcA
VPLLIYGLGVPVHDAISVSLAAVALTAGFGAAGTIRSGLLEFRAGLIFAIAGMLTAPIGVKASHWFSEPTIVTAFVVLMLVVALSMWRRATRSADVVPAAVSEAGPICRFNPNRQLRLTALCTLGLAAAGIGSGVLSGFFGIGGGFVIVPALTFLTQLDIHRAVATSLLVITLVGLSGVGAVLVEGGNFSGLCPVYLYSKASPAYMRAGCSHGESRGRDCKNSLPWRWSSSLCSC